jgi:hypothetical protein
MPKDYGLTPARLDQLRAAHRDAEATLDQLLAEPQIRQTLAEDDPAVALARIAGAIQQEFPHFSCASLLTLAVGRLIKADGGWTA